jgi:hypothetical protein
MASAMSFSTNMSRAAVLVRLFRVRSYTPVFVVFDIAV